MKTRQNGEGHIKPSLDQVIAMAKSAGYIKHFVCSSCKKPSKRLTTTKAEEGVKNCIDCSDLKYTQKRIDEVKAVQERLEPYIGGEE